MLSDAIVGLAPHEVIAEPLCRQNYRSKRRKSTVLDETTGFTQVMVPLEQRHLVADIIGAEAEAIVYRYCSCDRDLVWPRVGQAVPLPFEDRFTGETVSLPLFELREFCELTAANELQIAAGDPAFREQHRAGFTSLFRRMGPYLSDAGNRFAASLFDTAGADLPSA